MSTPTQSTGRTVHQNEAGVRYPPPHAEADPGTAPRAQPSASATSSAKPGSSPKPGGSTHPADEPPPHTVPPHSHPAQAFGQAMAQLGELKEYAGYYIAAKLDAIRVSVRNLGIWIALGLVGLLGVATVVVAAVVLLLWGIAGALAQVFPAHPWLGNLIVGAVVLLATVIGILFCMRAITRTFKSTTVDKYENRQRQQRQRFGHDVRSPSTTRHPTGPTH